MTSGATAIDNEGPQVSDTGVSEPLISPDLNGIKDSSTLTASLADVRLLDWTIKIINSAGTTIRHLPVGTATNATAVWNGKRDDGSTAPDGIYTPVIEARDSVRNVSTRSFPTIGIDLTKPAVSPSASPEPFSPNGDEIKPSTTLSAALSDLSEPLSWRLVVKDGSGAELRAWTGEGSSVERLWDGSDESGVVRGEGSYWEEITAVDHAGNSRTVSKLVRIDLSPPTLGEGTASNPRFSPMGDKTTTTISVPITQEPSTPITYTVSIKNPSGSIVRSSPQLTTSSEAASWIWDGSDQAGDPLADATYSSHLAATDAQGLSSTRVGPSVTIDTVQPTILDLTSDPLVFSPNGDGRQDATTLTAQISEDGTWNLAIQDLNGDIRRGFTGSSRSPEVSWDGRAESGERLPDGAGYRAVLKSTDLAGNSTEAFVDGIVIDTQAPVVSSYVASPNVFSPNGDGRKETSGLSATFDHTAEWLVELRHPDDGRTVRSFGGSGGSMGISWDGKDVDGALVEDEVFSAKLTVTDDVGNQTVESRPVTVDMIAPMVSSVFPLPGHNTIYSSQPIRISLADIGSRIDSTSISLVLKDLTDDTSIPLASTFDSESGTVSAVADGVAGTGLVENHIYAAQATFRDVAGNQSTGGHDSSLTGLLDGNAGFQMISFEAAASTATIPETSCTLSGPLTGRLATCSGITIELADSDVEVSGSRHSHGVGHIAHTFDLEDAVLTWHSPAGPLETNAYALRQPTGSEWQNREMEFAYQYGDRIALGDSVASASRVLSAIPATPSVQVGTLVMALPPTWSGASDVRLSMNTPTIPARAPGTCAVRDAAGVPCDTDPLWSRWFVELEDGESADTVSARHKTAHKVKIQAKYDWGIVGVPPAYEGTMSPAAVAAVSQDPDVAAMMALGSDFVQDAYEYVTELPNSPPRPGVGGLVWDQPEGVTQYLPLSAGRAATLTQKVKVTPATNEEGGDSPIDDLSRTYTFGLKPVGVSVADTTIAHATTWQRARYESTDGTYWIEAQPAGTTGIRYVIVLATDDAPTTFDFDLSLPDDTEMVVQGETAAIVRKGSWSVDAIVGHILPPVAIDGAGKRIEVDQAISGTSIRFTVHVNDSTTYPVVADPTYHALVCVGDMRQGHTAEQYFNSAESPDGSRCPYGLSFYWGQGYWPVTAGFGTGSFRTVSRYDECSDDFNYPVDKAPWFDFTVPCQMLKYGWHLLEVKDPFSYERVTESDVERQFLATALEECFEEQTFTPFNGARMAWKLRKGKIPNPPACYATAAAYYGAAVVTSIAHESMPYGWPDYNVLDSADFEGNNSRWVATGSQTATSGIKYNSLQDNYYYLLSCANTVGGTQPCGLMQRTEGSHFRGGEDLDGRAWLGCESSGGCNYRVWMEYFNPTSDAWLVLGYCDDTVAQNGPQNRVETPPCVVNAGGLTGAENHSVRWWIQSQSENQRLRVYYPSLKLVPAP